MQRIDIINTIGSDYVTGNLEQSGEFSYVKAGIPLSDIPKNSKGEQNYKLDIRFLKGNLAILVETLNIRANKQDKEIHKDKLLNSYCVLEQKKFPQNNIILILAEAGNSKGIVVWKKKVGENDIKKLQDTKIKTIEEYEKYFQDITVNNEILIKQSVLTLNDMLHSNGVPEGLRGQFVGTCLLALKSDDFIYQNITTRQIIEGIRQVIETLLISNDINKAKKIVLLDDKVLKNQKIRNLKEEQFVKILNFIKENIIPNINQNTNVGQDLLNLFFTTFNKYVGKTDKNQAFTPDHITHFMCKVAGINKNTKVLDPTCGSGSFIVQALIQELNECETEKEKDNVKKNNIYGIEVEEKAYGLSTTNMLIHGDGNSNVVFDEKQGCFGLRDWILENDIDVVLMNPPYNAKPNDIPEFIKDENGKIVYRVHDWNKKQKEGKTDPTKGFCFVNYIADCVGKDKNGNIRHGKKLLCLLPLSCAIGSDGKIQNEKIKILENNTLDAVFSLPPEMFYPGASVNACCMVFTLGVPHFTNDKNGNKIPRNPTFFGYYKEDGFIKKKNLGRISKTDSDNIPLWNKIEQLWLDLYKGLKNNPYLGIRKRVSATDEWLAEAYIETDYSKITDKNFQETLNKYFSYLVGNGYNFYKKLSLYKKRLGNMKLNLKDWKNFKVSDVLVCKTTKHLIETYPGEIPYVTRSAINNGVSEYIDQQGSSLNKGNCITIGAEGAFAFYQPNDFISGVKIYRLSHEKLNKYNALFLCTILNQEVYKYTYGRARILEKIKEEHIKLPAKYKLNKDGSKIYKENGEKIKTAEYEPDWEYMEKYIKSLLYADLI